MKTEKTKSTHTPGGNLAVISAKLRNLAVNNPALAGELHAVADQAWAESTIQKDLLEALYRVLGSLDSVKPLSSWDADNVKRAEEYARAAIRKATGEDK